MAAKNLMTEKSRRLNILIVDDNLMDVMAAFYPLFQQGHRITLCLGGEDALYEAASDQFDLVILDWKMPVLSGKDFLSRVKWNPEKSGHPLRVVVHTSAAVQAGDLPANKDFIDVLDVWKKPLSPRDLLLKFNHLKGIL